MNGVLSDCHREGEPYDDFSAEPVAEDVVGGLCRTLYGALWNNAVYLEDAFSLGVFDEVGVDLEHRGNERKGRYLISLLENGWDLHFYDQGRTTESSAL